MTKTPRRGISEEQIREAIDLLQGEGESPSPAKIRRILGSGSYSTICRVLTAWREEESAKVARTPEMPASVKRLATRLWNEATSVAAELHNAARVGFETERKEWQAEKNDLITEVDSLENRHTELSESLKEKEALLAQAQERNAALEKEISAAKARAETLDDQLSRIHEQWSDSNEPMIATNGTR